LEEEIRSDLDVAAVAFLGLRYDAAVVI
jgi:hypothetical protein